MAIEIIAGNFLNNIKEAKIIKIYKNIGDKVRTGEVLFDLEGGKATTSIKSTVNGEIESINTEAGDTVKSDTVLARINENKAGINSINTAGQSENGDFNYFSNLLKPTKEELSCDITIIGGGPGGYVAAIKAAKLGAKVILVEKEIVGGTCLNYGCIPTKSFVRSAQVYSQLKSAEEFGCYAENISFSITKIVERKNKVVQQLVQGIKYLLDKNNVRVINGMGKLINEKTVVVQNTMQKITIKTKKIIIATGSKSAKPSIQGLENKNIINSNEALELRTLPKKMAIIGGGVIGMEFAFVFANLGVDVSVVEYFDSCLLSCDEDICRANEDNAIAKGIKLYTGAKVEEILNTENDECIVSFIQNNTKKHITADKVLVAVGRTPYIEGLELESIGIELNGNKKGIKINSKMQTNIPNIYAIGDVTNTIQLAHIASNQGIVAVNNIMGNESEMDYLAVPSAIFTDPEIAMVGICEKEAHKRALEIEVGKFPYAANGKALTFGECSGFVKLIKAKDSGKIIGGAIVGLHATDLISEITLAIKNDLTAKQLTETIHAHPTTAEVIYEAALACE